MSWTLVLATLLQTQKRDELDGETTYMRRALFLAEPSIWIGKVLDGVNMFRCFEFLVADNFFLARLVDKWSLHCRGHDDW